MIGARARWTGWGGGEGSKVWQVYVYNLLVYRYFQLIYCKIYLQFDKYSKLFWMIQKGNMEWLGRAVERCKNSSCIS